MGDLFAFQQPLALIRTGESLDATWWHMGGHLLDPSTVAPSLTPPPPPMQVFPHYHVDAQSVGITALETSQCVQYNSECTFTLDTCSAAFTPGMISSTTAGTEPPSSAAASGSSCSSSTAKQSAAAKLKRTDIRCYEHGCGGRGFSTIGNYRRHVKEQNGQAKVYMCELCGKKFSRSTAMKLHEKRHHETPPNQQDGACWSDLEWYGQSPEAGWTTELPQSWAQDVAPFL